MTKKKNNSTRAGRTKPTPRGRATAASNRKASAARESLCAAINAACLATGEAQWKNGYRCGATADNDGALYQREMELWAHVGVLRRHVDGAIARFAAAIRATKEPR